MGSRNVAIITILLCADTAVVCLALTAFEMGATRMKRNRRVDVTVPTEMRSSMVMETLGSHVFWTPSRHSHTCPRQMVEREARGRQCEKRKGQFVELRWSLVRCKGDECECVSIVRYRLGSRRCTSPHVCKGRGRFVCFMRKPAPAPGTPSSQ